MLNCHKHKQPSQHYWQAVDRTLVSAGMYIKGMLRRLVLGMLRWSGVMRLWRFLHRHEVIILMVHGVMDTEGSARWVPLRRQMSRSRLEASLAELAKYYHFVSLDDAVEMITGRIPVRPYSLVLTFDDGYRNNVKYALPILRRYGAPGTFFLVTRHIEERKPLWFDRLDYALQKAPVDGREVLVGGSTVRLRAGDRAALRASYKRLRDAAKTVPRHDLEMLQEMDRIAFELEGESGQKLADIWEDDDWSAMLTWENVRAAIAGDVTFGSHTVDHIRLALVDDEMIQTQLLCSKWAIEARTGRPCHHLCYPGGSFSRRAAEIARTTGYASAVTSVGGRNRVGDDAMTLRRMSLPVEGSMTELVAKVSGLMDAVSRLRRLLFRQGREVRRGNDGRER